jgi:signal transduction histidine kinase
MKLRTKLTLYNFLSKFLFAAMLVALMPYALERINISQTDKELVRKRQKVLEMVSSNGIEPFISVESENKFSSYNILKDEFISIEKVPAGSNQNFIEASERKIEDEVISFRVLSYNFSYKGQSYLLEIGKSLESMMHARRNIVRLTWGLLLLIILITLFSDLYYTYRVLHPLDLIIKKLKGTSVPGVFDKVPVNTSTYDFRQLDQTLIELMNRIDDLFRKERDVTVNISHDLLTPVSVLRSKLENILLQENIDNELSVKIEESLRTLHRLKTLVNSHLLIARIENRQYLKDESFALGDVILDIVNELSPIAIEAGIDLRYEKISDLDISNANRSLLFSMFYNVINNGVRNTRSGGFVTVTSSYIDKKFTVVVKDSGVGISEEQLRNLFSRFNSRSKVDEDHVGIGLAITKTISDFHNILIKVESKVNAGSAFSFIFPENS